jgi:hypothetical protein
MTKPASIADLKTQKVTEVDLFSGDIETARRSKVVLLNLIDDQSARALPGVTSFVLFDEEDHGIEDTTVNGTAQSDLSGGMLPTTLEINKFRSVPGYFKYVLGETSRVNWVQGFVSAAPMIAILDVEKAAIAALRGIGATAGKFRQLSGTDSGGIANMVPTVSDYAFAIKELTETMKLDINEIRTISSQSLALELPTVFGLYDKEATSALGDLAKTKGFIREIMGVPHFASLEVPAAEHIFFHRRAVSYAIRTMAQLVFQGMASSSQDYYGVNISYGVVARQDNRAVVMQSGATFAA